MQSLKSKEQGGKLQAMGPILPGSLPPMMPGHVKEEDWNDAEMYLFCNTILNENGISSLPIINDLH